MAVAPTSMFVEVVHLTSPQKQQEVLKRFHGVDGLTALGTSTGDDHLVVFGCFDDLMKSAAEVILADIDQDAVCTYVSEPPLSLTAPGPGGAA